MGSIEVSVLLVIAVVALAWVIFRVVAGLGAGGQSSARADTFVSGAGYAAEQSDNIRCSIGSGRRPFNGTVAQHQKHFRERRHP